MDVSCLGHISSLWTNPLALYVKLTVMPTDVLIYIYMYMYRYSHTRRESDRDRQRQIESELRASAPVGANARAREALARSLPVDAIRRLENWWVREWSPGQSVRGGSAPRCGSTRATEWAPLRGRARPNQIVCTAGWRPNTQIGRGLSCPRPRAGVGGELFDGGGAWPPDGASVGATGGPALRWVTATIIFLKGPMQ